MPKTYSNQELQRMRAPELKRVLQERGESTHDCLEKADLIQKAFDTNPIPKPEPNPNPKPKPDAEPESESEPRACSMCQSTTRKDLTGTPNDAKPMQRCSKCNEVFYCSRSLIQRTCACIPPHVNAHAYTYISIHKCTKQIIKYTHTHTNTHTTHHTTHTTHTHT